VQRVGWRVTVVILGGAGFVGLNLARALLRQGASVRILDRAMPPEALRDALEAPPGRLDMVTGDVTGADSLREAIRPGTDTVVMGAAVTADAAREASAPATILAVNLDAVVPILEASRRAGIRRVVNLSSAAVYGGARAPAFAETVPAEPESLYAVTKFASEKVLARLCTHWGLDGVSLRLSAVFGPFERQTGLRDTISPQTQIWAAAEAGMPALLPRPGVRDWIYAPDVADAVSRIIAAPRLRHTLYNVSAPERWPVLAWGRLIAEARPGFVCRLAEPGETPTIALHGPADRPPLTTDRMKDEVGWSAAHGLEAAAADFIAWHDGRRERAA
jgi:UDP-glucose 4-epimerase